MSSFSNVKALILVLLSYNCEVSTGNQYDTQFSKIEEELLNVMGSILNLLRDLNKERTERRENTEVLNRTISKCACEKELQNLRNLLESRLNEQKDDLKAHDAKLKAFESQTGKVKTDMESLKTDLTKMENNIRTDLISHSPQIAFHARLGSSLSTFSNGQLLVFDDVYLNLGDGYQRNRGVFSAPVTGLYILMLTVSSENNPAPDYEVVLNGTPLCRVAVSTGTYSYIGSPCNAIVHLNKGDEVWAKAIVLHEKDTLRGSFFTTFSMGLVSAK